MSHPPEKKRDSLFDLPGPRDPKLPPTQLLEAPEERAQETTGVRPWAEAPEAFDDVTRPLGDAVTLDEPGAELSLDELDDELVPLSWDEATLVDVAPDE